MSSPIKSIIAGAQGLLLCASMKNVYLVITLLSALTLSACGPQSRSSGMKTMTVPKSKQAQQLAEQIAQPSLDMRCEFTALENQLIKKSQITDGDRKKILDILLVTLRGTNCEKTVSILKDEFKDSSLLEHINTRTAQLKSLNGEKVLDILSNNKKITFDGLDLWNTASEIVAISDLDSNQVSVKGKIIAGNKAAVISTVIPSGKIKDIKNIQAKEIAEAAKSQAYVFEKDEFKSIGQNTSSKAAEELDEIETRVANQLKEIAAQEKPKISKFTFDQSDSKYLEICGVAGIRQEIQKNMIGSTSDIVITKLIDVKAEKVFTNSLTKTIDQQRLEASISNNPYQKVENQGFWIFSKDEKKAVEISLITRQTPADLAISNMLLYNMFSREYDMTKGDVAKETLQGAVNYQIKKQAGMASRFAIKLDPSSAFWLASQSDNIAKCMEEQKFAAVGASRDSIKTYILYSTVENYFKKEVSALNPVVPTQK